MALPGPQDTIDPDFAGIRSSLASLGIGYIGYTNNSFYDNMLPVERTTFGQQTYNGRADLPIEQRDAVDLRSEQIRNLRWPGRSRRHLSVRHLESGRPEALSLATFSYYQTFLNKQVELKFGYLNNSFEFWGPYLSGNLSSSIFGPSEAIPIETGLNAYRLHNPVNQHQDKRTPRALRQIRHSTSEQSRWPRR